MADGLGEECKEITLSLRTDATTVLKTVAGSQAELGNPVGKLLESGGSSRLLELLALFKRSHKTESRYQVWKAVTRQ
jgi:hypothetical protein